MAVRQIELKKILLPYFAATMGARHHGEMWGAIQPYRDVTELGKHLEVAAGPAAKIQYRIRRLTLDALQQRSDVLVDVVIARAFPEILGMLVVVTQREISDLCQVFRIQFHVRSGSHTHPACTRIESPQRGRDIIAGQMRLVEAPRNVRFGSIADIDARPNNVRFTPKSGHCIAPQRM